MAVVDTSRLTPTTLARQLLYYGLVNEGDLPPTASRVDLEYQIDTVIERSSALCPYTYLKELTRQEFCKAAVGELIIIRDQKLRDNLIDAILANWHGPKRELTYDEIKILVSDKKSPVGKAHEKVAPEDRQRIRRAAVDYFNKMMLSDKDEKLIHVTLNEDGRGVADIFHETDGWTLYEKDLYRRGDSSASAMNTDEKVFSAVTPFRDESRVFDGRHKKEEPCKPGDLILDAVDNGEKVFLINPYPLKRDREEIVLPCLDNDGMVTFVRLVIS